MSTLTHTSKKIEPVLGYHNENLIQRLMKKENMTRQQAEDLFVAVKQFLFVCGTHKNERVPNESIDIGWHHFILFTKDYANFCHEMFGQFIHHTPGNSAFQGKELFQATYASAYKLFGELLSPCWGQGTDGKINCSSGACEGSSCSDHN